MRGSPAVKENCNLVNLRCSLSIKTRIYESWGLTCGFAGGDLVDFSDLKAKAKRMRDIADLLNDPRDAAIVRQYARELEERARAEAARIGKDR